MAGTLEKVIDLKAQKLRQVDIAVLTGLSQARVSNCLRVAEKAKPQWLAWVAEGRLSQKHLEAVLPLPVPEAEELLRTALAYKWSYSRLRSAIAARGQGRTIDGDAKDPNLLHLETRLQEIVGAKVRIDARPDGSGELVLCFHDASTLEGLLERVGYREG